MGILGFVLLLFSSFVAVAAPVDFLETEAEVIAEYCRTYNAPSAECGYGYKSRMVRVHVPEDLAQTILAHINEARAQGYYDNISNLDFFHGHQLLHGPQIAYEADAYFQDFNAVVYHTAEYNDRWSKEAKQGIPVEKRRARSIVGWSDGTIQKAIELIQPGFIISDSYNNAGTIGYDEVANSVPGLTDHKVWGNHYQMLDLTVCKGTDCRVCNPEPAVTIVQTPNGRFTTAVGEKIDLYVRCMYPRPY